MSFGNTLSKAWRNYCCHSKQGLCDQTGGANETTARLDAGKTIGARALNSRVRNVRRAVSDESGETVAECVRTSE